MVKYTKVVQSYEIGGLKLIDLQAKDASLKAAWVTKAMLVNSPEHSPLYHNLPIKDKSIWECNISPSEVKALATKYGHNCSYSFSIWKEWASSVADPGFPVGGHFLVKMYAKTKELGPMGGVRRARPPRSANAH